MIQIGTRVRVIPHDGLKKEYENLEATVVKEELNSEYFPQALPEAPSIVHRLFRKDQHWYYIQPGPYVPVPESVLSPLDKYDGNDASSWDKCIWQPKSEAPAKVPVTTQED